MKQARVFTLTLKICSLVNTNQKDDCMRPRTCSGNGAYRNASEQQPWTSAPSIVSQREERREVHVSEPTQVSHPWKFRQNIRACVYSLSRAPNLARCTQAARRAPERLHDRTSHATIKECHPILRWFLGGKERLQRREHLQSELRRGEAGGDRKQIGEGWR